MSYRVLTEVCPFFKSLFPGSVNVLRNPPLLTLHDHIVFSLERRKVQLHPKVRTYIALSLKRRLSAMR